MKTIAHRGGMQGGMQNSPEGGRLAARHKADLVELDVVKGRDGTFLCAHGLGERRKLADCLAEVGDQMAFTKDTGQWTKMNWFLVERGYG